MSAGVPDAMDLVELRCRPRAQPISERLEGPSVSAILCLELAELCFGTTQNELGERWRVGAEALTKRLECGGERRRLGDRVSRMRRGHTDECSTVQHPVARRGPRSSSLSCPRFISVSQPFIQLSSDTRL